MANRGNHLKLGNQREISFSLLSLSLTISLLSAVSTPAAVVANSTDSGINEDTSANSAAPVPASSAHWSLPFSGSIKPAPTAPAPNADPATGKSHPFPIANSYQVMKFADDKGTPTVTPPQVFRRPIATTVPTNLPPGVLSGQVSEWEGPLTLDRMVSHLVDETYDRSPEGKKLDKQVKHFGGRPARAAAVTKDAFEHTFQYQGFDPSIRAGRLILNDKYKVRNIAWAEYERQKFVDNIHSQVVTSMMQLAEGIGMNPASGAPVIASAKGALESLVGEEETQRTITGLTLWLNHTKVPDDVFGQTPWSTIERNKKLEDIIKTALVRDSVVKEVTTRVNKYAHPNAAMNASVKVLDTGLSGIAYFAPGLAIPLVAETLEAGLKESTGGSEENKLEREMLFDKRIQSRFKVLNHEASMAVDNYRYALVTRNPQLLVFSQQVITDMAGQEQLAQLVPTSNPITIPEAKDPKGKSSGTGGGIKIVQKKGKSLLDKLPL
jgi:hypothetical protein